MLFFWERIEIRAATGRHVQSHRLCYMWNHVNGLWTDCFVRRKNIFWEFSQTVTTNISKFLVALSARNTISQSARPGDRVVFLTRPKPNASRLRRPGAVRAQPCIPPMLDLNNCVATSVDHRYHDVSNWIETSEKCRKKPFCKLFSTWTRKALTV